MEWGSPVNRGLRHREIVEAIKQGATLIKLKRMKVISEIARMKFSISNQAVDELDVLQQRLEREM